MVGECCEESFRADAHADVTREWEGGDNVDEVRIGKQR